MRTPRRFSSAPGDTNDLRSREVWAGDEPRGIRETTQLGERGCGIGTSHLYGWTRDRRS